MAKPSTGDETLSSPGRLREGFPEESSTSIPPGFLCPECFSHFTAGKLLQLPQDPSQMSPPLSDIHKPYRQNEPLTPWCS